MRRCKLNMAGVDYFGSMSRGDNGETCEYWNNTGLSAYQLSLLNDVDTILTSSKQPIKGNECRNFDSDLNGPWCYNKELQQMTCEIPYCGER